ncbi:PTS sugar transporter subunit IIB [Companilactobacillus kimchiensis]|uniref:PTS permease n=1 Tax=Companilactobacillus kimchiensis TaxID=993692 RepID=A0A0R2LGH8_9LACO|nr:PTS sugar transporter subunit IIB [Companilactobacillus kimchiensis]KRN98933.1 PTS permease [Companilactobacillus kimchiensis]
MIKLVRIDHRLLHGQVAFAWTPELNVDAIMIVNDAAATDDTQRSIIRMAKPQGVKLAIKTVDDAIATLKSGKTNDLTMFVIVGNVEDAVKLQHGYPEIKHINLGGMKVREGTRNLTKAVNLLPEEEEQLKQLIADGIEVELRQVPGDKAIPVQKLIK